MVTNWILLESPDRELREKLVTPTSQRLLYVKVAMVKGFSIEEIYKLSGIDPWFLDRMYEIYELERELKEADDVLATPELLRLAKRYGFSDRQLAFLCEKSERDVRQSREVHGVHPVFKTVDTCAAEFEAFTPYHYSTYERESESVTSDREKIMILGGGPNRIGQGIEFDYLLCPRLLRAARRWM